MREHTYRLGTAAALLVLAAAYAWWATLLRPFTGPCLWATIAGGAAAVTAGWRFGRPGPVERGRATRGTGVWVALVVALCGWELASFVQHPRAAHPTLSSIANDVLGNHPARAVAMLAWLALGARIGRP